MKVHACWQGSRRCTEACTPLRRHMHLHCTFQQWRERLAGFQMSLHHLFAAWPGRYVGDGKPFLSVISSAPLFLSPLTLSPPPSQIVASSTPASSDLPLSPRTSRGLRVRAWCCPSQTRRGPHMPPTCTSWQRTTPPRSSATSTTSTSRTRQEGG